MNHNYGFTKSHKDHLNNYKFHKINTKFNTKSTPSSQHHQIDPASPRLQASAPVPTVPPAKSRARGLPAGLRDLRRLRLRLVKDWIGDQREGGVNGSC
jgi:hypothetical protein